MCGINVIINSEIDGQKAIESMMNATIHRGPDHSGFSKVSENVFFAGNRLKILDLSDTSNQPLWNKDKDAVLIWNGALYNYQDLRNELLDLGCEFIGSSDSEVLLNWLKFYGTDKIHALKGMFALAFADLAKKEIIIARDISGEKPLYFLQNEKSWYFSSETKGILAGYDGQLPIDTIQFIPFFYYRHSFPDGSFYQQIHQVLSGEVMVLDFSGKLLNKQKLSIPHFKRNRLSQSIFEETLKDAVLKNFNAERPVGMVLSGGADSSLLYSLWYEETGQPLNTFTVALEKKYQSKYNDPYFAKYLGKRYPSFHHEILVSQSDLRDNWPEYIKSMDQPIGDSAGFLTWIVAKTAKEKVKVLVSGAGADELFGGYNRHRAFNQYLKHPKLFKFLKAFGTKFPFPTSWKKVLQSIQLNPELTFIQMAALQPIPDQFLEEFQKWYPQHGSLIKNALEWDRTFYLVNDILKVHDNACMSNGIEGRSPYLDMDLLSMVQAQSYLDNLIGKKLIKSALQNRGLGKIANRRKLGFGLPLLEWFEEKEFRNWVFEPIKEMEKTWGPDFPPEMRKLAANPEKSDKRQFLQLWNLFILASWLKNNE
ncbi:asparagine synthase (glutamine-hydrolyzing) [Aquiflexum sp.]|uniref:asparagine synthase (glutamine-hydrolyzing) n=1 Tax=Aquiflexum sp. TaxID=1872584 RepID=UPI00359332EB